MKEETYICAICGRKYPISQQGRVRRAIPVPSLFHRRDRGLPCLRRTGLD